MLYITSDTHGAEGTLPKVSLVIHMVPQNIVLKFGLGSQPVKYESKNKSDNFITLTNLTFFSLMVPIKIHL